MFDYTNSYDGVSSSGSVNSHNKQDGFDPEISFVSPSSFVTTPVYVVGGENNGNLYTINWPDGSLRQSRTVTYGQSSINVIAWIPNTTLCLVMSNSNKYALIDFMNQNVADKNFVLPTGASAPIGLVISKKRRLAFVPEDVLDETHVLRLSSEYPCSNLCQECGDIPNECTNCKPNSEHRASDKSCVCQTNFYAVIDSGGGETCHQCSQLCQDCTGPGDAQCSSCKYPLIMEKKSDGSCGCKDGSFSTGPTTCGACDPSCLTCSKAGKNGCSSCEPHKTYFADEGRCTGCDPSCKTCSDPGPNKCLSCHQDKPFWFNSVSGTCSPCNDLYATCSGPSEIECSSCSFFAFQSTPGTCLSCAEGDSSTCPAPIKIKLAETLDEKNSVLNLTMTPALTTSHPHPSEVTAEALLQKHLRITIKRKDENDWNQIEIESKILQNTATNSKLTIVFKREVKAPEVKRMRVEVIDPWVYRTELGVAPEKVIYFKKKSSEEIELKESEEQLNSIAFAKTVGGIMGGTVATGLGGKVALQALKLAENISIYAMFKYMNFIDMILAITRVNVELEPRLRILVEFLENLKIPKIALIGRSSPIRDSKEGDKDVDGRIRLIRGRRGKMTKKNGMYLFFKDRTSWSVS